MDPGPWILTLDPGLWMQHLGSWLDPGPRILDPGFRIQDPGSRILDPGSWILDSGSKLRDPGPWIQDPGSRILDLRFWIQHPGFWILDLGFRIPDLGSWIQDPESGILDPEPRTLRILDPGWILDPVIQKPHRPRNNYVVDHNRIAIGCPETSCRWVVPSERTSFSTTLEPKCDSALLARTGQALPKD